MGDRDIRGQKQALRCQGRDAIDDCKQAPTDDVIEPPKRRQSHR